MLIKIWLNERQLKRLTELSFAERRPLRMQAEVMLLQALGCWPDPEEAPPAPPVEVGRAR
jgi:hypothetical protein